jgi:hypothetical protein
MSQTESQYRSIIASCKNLFLQKNQDYGTSWRILRLPSVTDQIYIKASRIRSIQEKGIQLVSDSLESEFVGIINYCIIALIQAQLSGTDSNTPIPYAELEKLYDQEAGGTLDLLMRKNHDYSEAWRDMRISSITDIILMKLHRLKQIENNDGETLVSEGAEANYQDILNYAVFALIIGKDKGDFS